MASPMSIPTRVSTGLIALRNAWWRTIRLRGIPFASAVRMYGSSITSIIRTRTSRV